MTERQRTCQITKIQCRISAWGNTRLEVRFQDQDGCSSWVFIHESSPGEAHDSLLELGAEWGTLDGVSKERLEDLMAHLGKFNRYPTTWAWCAPWYQNHAAPEFS